MYNKIEELNELNNIINYLKPIYSDGMDDKDYQITLDYLQKISYSIQDINKELKNVKFTMKDIVYIFILIDWIREAYKKIINITNKFLIDNYIYSKETELKKAMNYFTAIRSFAVAHPLNTNRHEKFGFSGDFICVDFATSTIIDMLFVKDDDCLYIDYDGLHNGKNNNHIYYFKTYSSKKNDNKYFVYISFDMNDVLRVGRLCLGSLREMNKYIEIVKGKKR